jgi:hypothetical protein
MTQEQQQPYSIRAQFRRPVFWVTGAVYILLTIGVRYFVFSPLFRTFVEQNQEGLLKGYFSYLAGYDVVGAVIQKISVDIFLFQQLLAVLVMLILWRNHKAVAVGILAVILTFTVIFSCAVLLFLVFGRTDY